MHQRITAMISFLLLSMGFGSLGFAEALAPTQIESKTANGIRYLSGGIGEDEQEVLSALGKTDDLKLVFATREGNYLSDVAVVIRDGHGNKVLAAVAEGPWLYTDLPTGRYLISATIQGETRQQTVRVNSGKQTQLYFHW